MSDRAQIEAIAPLPELDPIIGVLLNDRLRARMARHCCTIAETAGMLGAHVGELLYARATLAHLIVQVNELRKLIDAASE